MKKCLILVICVFTSIASMAGHIAGGEVYYRYIGPGSAANTDNYEITLRLFRECNPPPGSQPTAAMPVDVIVGIFNNSSPSSLFSSQTVNRTSLQTIILSTPGACIINAPEVCYQVGSFTFRTDLPVTVNGYVLSFQTCCRTNGIANIVAGVSVGATYSADIPGRASATGAINSSAVFSLKDTTLVCKNVGFTLDFGATDPDGDSLSYSFCTAYNGGNTTNSTNVTPSNPPYGNLSYQAPYSGAQPLGPTVTINPRTGLISGTAPVAGSYVINVCVSEFRNGALLTVHRKDFTLKIGDCNIADANLNPNTFFLCDSLTRSFLNGSTSAGIVGYAWNFGDPASGANNTSTQPNPTHTYSDTGIFKLYLQVQNAAGCTARDSALVNVFPGFNADFTFTGSCYVSPFQFTDRSTTSYGVVNNWRWDFGDLSTSADTSRIKNPSYLYPSGGIRNVELIVTNTKGCADTLIKPVDIKNVPFLNLPFKDTLICSIDTLPLIAQGSGSFAWTPNYNIINPNSANPLVYPKITTTYIVTLNESGCVSKDSIKVNVLDFITVDAGSDTSICRTDSMRMRPVSQALQYRWTPAANLSNPNIKFPYASPVNTTKYYVTANLGKCQDSDSLIIRVGPYPQAYAGLDTAICFADPAQLNGTIVGSSFTWTPSSSLQNANTLTPIARPVGTTSYILAAFDTVGCPKPFRDTVVVNVNPRIIAFAGNDTTIVANQPLQLNARGGSIYAWSPATGMNNPNIPNPVVILGTAFDSITYTVRVSIPIGCAATDDIKVRIFKTGPDIFVPSGFTPNRDGRNDVLKPILVGMKGLNYFRVFNRWGKMIYTTAEIGKGWDGRVSGIDQASGTFVYMAEGIDYLGNTLFRKGTVILIR